MPTSHNQTVDRMRLLLIHTIMTGYRVNIREILAKELAAACANDKGIFAFPCLISALYRRAAVPTSHGDKYQAEKTGWTRVVYMRKMDVADATPLNVPMQTPPSSSIRTTAATADEAGPSAPAAPVEPRHSPVASPPVVPVSSHTTTTSPTTTPADVPASRASTPDSPLGSTPAAPQSQPQPAQSEEAAPIHILLLRNQLQRIEARQIQMQAETKVFQQNLLAFLCFQFPAAANFHAQPKATATANRSTTTQPIPSANPSTRAGSTEEVHFSSDDENDVFDWQSPWDYLQPISPTPSKPTEAVPIFSAPTPATSAIVERPIPDSPARRRGKAPAGRSFGRNIPSSPAEEEPEQRPAKRQRRYHIITADSDDDRSAEVPVAQLEKSVDPSLSTTF
ncbi:hypothetical protein V6N13_063700 [Hibiscus sabdariffa]